MEISKQPEGGTVRSLALVGLLLIACLPTATAFSWRLFAGSCISIVLFLRREECVSEYLSEIQWNYIKEHEKSPEDVELFIDVAFMVSSVHGGGDAAAAVDYALHSPKGVILKHENGVSEAEIGISAAGGQGPWHLCFRVSSGSVLRPSVMVNVPYFMVNFEDFSGDFEWEDEGSLPNLDVEEFGSKQQIEDLEVGLLRLDRYLTNVTNEQRFLHARTVRHLKTVESTLTRTFWYYLAIYVVICAASFSQLWAVRMLFKRSRRQGLII